MYEEVFRNPNDQDILVIALTQAATPKTMLSEFSASGICSLRRNFFEDSHFTPCQVTDRTSTYFQSECIPSPKCFATSLSDEAVGLNVKRPHTKPQTKLTRMDDK